MQHHPGSWYFPWGVPLQKMMTVPFNPSQQMAAPGYHQPPQMAQAPPTQQQAQQSPTPQTYQQQLSALHNAAALQHQTLHPAAAAAMFTPLTLRSFVTHPHMNLQQQQQMPGATHQPHQQQQQQHHHTNQQQHTGGGTQHSQHANANVVNHHHGISAVVAQQQSQLTALNINGVSVLPAAVRQHTQHTNVTTGSLMMPMKKVS